MTRIIENKGETVKWVATDLGVRLKVFVYDDRDVYLLPCELEIGYKTLRAYLAAVDERLVEQDTMLPPWQ